MPLELKRRKGSPYWIMRGSIKGRRIEESTGTRERKLAEKIRTEREEELLRQAFFGHRSTATFAKAAVSYMETGGRHGEGGERRYLSAVLQDLGSRLLVNITHDVINSAALRRYPKAKPATRNRQYVTPAIAVISHAARLGYCPPIVVARPKQSRAAPRWITPQEGHRLIEACTGSMKALVTFLLYTGCRAGEALWLDWKDVDLSRAHVTFAETKNGEARGVPLHPIVVTVLANLPHRERSVFRRPDGEPYARPQNANDTSAGSRIKTGFKAACRRAGIENFRVHDCRHTWATWHYAANRDLIALMKLGGWKSERMVLRYAHVNVSELAHTINALDGGNLGEPPLTERKNS